MSFTRLCARSGAIHAARAISTSAAAAAACVATKTRVPASRRSLSRFSYMSPEEALAASRNKVLPAWARDLNVTIVTQATKERFRHPWLDNYTSPVLADRLLVALDASGTTLDLKNEAPNEGILIVLREEGILDAFEEDFPNEGEIRLRKIIEDMMGRTKEDHIDNVVQAIALQWKRIKGREPNKQDSYRIYQRFCEVAPDCIRRHGKLIEGALDLQKYCRKKGYPLVANSGYTKEQLKTAMKCAKEQGFRAQKAISSSEVPEGRPAPHMLLTLSHKFNVPPSRCIAIGDTRSDIEAAHRAGMWAILTLTGNSMGKSREELIKSFFGKRAPHFTISSIKDAPIVIGKMKKLLTRGILPHDYLPNIPLAPLKHPISKFS